MTMLTRTKVLGSVVTAASLIIGLTACGGGNKTQSASQSTPQSTPAATSQSSAAKSAADLSGELHGAGATAQQQAMTAWIADFKKTNPAVTVNYDGIGSGAGIKKFVGKSVAWAGSDAYLKDKAKEEGKKSELEDAKARCGGEAWDLPVYISPIAVIFNIDGVKDLNLTADTVAQIFSGKITKWNDPAIVETNKDAKLPDLAITAVHRSDESGTTQNFTEYLHSAAKDSWPDKASKAWPIQTGEAVAKTDGVVSTVGGTQGTIGYVDASKAGSLGTVALGSKDGKFVKFSEKAAAKAAETATRAEGRDKHDIALKVNRVPETNDSYPLVLISYSIVCSKYDDAKQGELVKAFVGYQASAEGQAAAAKAAGSAPISESLRGKINEALEAINK